MPWNYVVSHFSGFLNNLSLKDAEHADAQGKALRIGCCLHNVYYTGAFDPSNMLLTGSYGKGTAILPTSDVDLMYFMPLNLYERYNSYLSNGQSALLQDIKETLGETFSTTKMRADGQIVEVNFGSYVFEVVPAFNFGTHIVICDTNNGGRWKQVAPFQEASDLNMIDTASQGSARALIMYLKAWKRNQSVPLKSIILEVAACVFLRSWSCLNLSIICNRPIFWHDWMVRDFFQFLLNFHTAILPGTGEKVAFGEGWQRKTEEALKHAQMACLYEYMDMGDKAEQEWKIIFGVKFPMPTLSTLSKSALLSLMAPSTYGRPTLLGGI